MSAAALLELRDLTVAYPRPRAGWLARSGSFNAVDRVSLQVAAGQTLGIVGESGCGKSTLGRAALHLQAIAGGSVAWSGADVATLRGGALREKRREMQMVFQDPGASLDPRMTTRQSIERPLLNFDDAPPALRRRELVDMLMARVGLEPSWADRYPHELSGGQCQRVGIARALIVSPKMLVCDEPVSALDVSTQAQIVNLLMELRATERLAMLFISHNMAVVRHVCDRVLVLYLGKVVEVATSAAFFASPLHPYSRALVASVPVPDPAIERIRPPVPLVGNEIPSPLAPPSGCAFRTRCPHADASCVAEVPALRTMPDGRSVACHHVERLS